jgi:hypothetical protein
VEPDIVFAAIFALIGAGLPEATARFLRRKRLTNADSADDQSPQVSAQATLAEAAEIARDDHVDQLTVTRHHATVGTVHLEGSSGGVGTGSASPRKRFDITFSDVAYGIAMLIGVGAKAVWDYENKYHRVGVNWLQVNLALLVAPVVYIGVSNALQSSSQEPVSLPRLALAFQNGFFWQTVFSSISESGGSGAHG